MTPRLKVDFPQVSFPVYADAPRHEMLQFVPPEARRILDVGCNAGAFGAALKQQSAREVHGVEPNAATAAIATTRLDRVYCTTFDELTPLDGMYDAIIFNDVIEHLNDPWQILKLARDRLNPGGCVVASIPNLLHRDNLLHILVEQDFRYEEQGIRDRTHLRFFTARSIRRLFDDCTFDIEQLVGINPQWWTPGLLNRLAYTVLSKALEPTKYVQYAVVARPRSNLGAI